MAAIIVQNLGKSYKIYSSRLGRLINALTGGRYKNPQEKWVLRDINFTVTPGESIGIIGQNGAGKSTLLKIITGTTPSTQGKVVIQGKVAALLELGMGFNPEFSGRENAIMTCQLMGLSNFEINELLPSIKEFSELGEYFEQPLRTYSSGMQIRLAFSAATAVRPEILIVDEALSVGDAYFQHKCIAKIREFKEQGTTLFFVSHDPGAVKTLCDRAIMLENGQMVKDGTPSDVLDFYNAMIVKKEAELNIKQLANEYGQLSTRSGNNKARIDKVELLDANQKSARVFMVGELITLSCIVHYREPIEQATLGFMIRDRLGREVFGTNSYYLKHHLDVIQTPLSLKIDFQLGLNLGPGDYSLSLSSHTGDSHISDNHDWWDNALMFRIIPNGSLVFVGVAYLPIAIKSEVQHLKASKP